MTQGFAAARCKSDEDEDDDEYEAADDDKEVEEAEEVEVVQTLLQKYLDVGEELKKEVCRMLKDEARFHVF